MKKNRSTLKDYFKKGAIPTEANFADLIDSMLTQDEDNISKLPNDPLKITATGVDEALLNFYRVENTVEKIAWQIKQKPDGNKLGLSIGDNAVSPAASRMFIESGTGNVGIGTTTPTGRLNISEAIGTLNQPANGTLVLDHENAGGASSIVFRSKVNRGSDYGYIQYQDTATIGGTGEKAVLTIGIQNDADDHIALMPSGNVGIGTTTPAAKLHVSGGQIMLDGAQKLVFADGDVSNNLKLQLWNGYGLGINSGTLFYAADGNHSWRDVSGTNERMLLTTGAAGGLTVKGTGNSSFAGNLGIGSTSPYNPQGWNKVLEVMGTSNARLNVRSGGGVVTSVFSHDDWGGARGAIGTDSNHPLTFVTNYAHRMTIDGTGNVGVGTTAPAGRLNISEATGTVNGANSGTLVLDHENAGGASSIVFRSKVNRTSDYGYIQYQDTATIGGTGETAVLTIGTQNDADDHIVLMPSGNVGIGILPSPSTKLEVLGAVTIHDGNGFAAKNGYMTSGSLTIGSTAKNFGGGSGWNANTAGLLLEALNNTEIAVHDSSNRIASLMYYEGDAANRITIGRDMGWGIIGGVVINGGLSIVNGTSIFNYNGAADVTLRYPPRGSGGRAIVHDGGNVLALNYANDFNGGVRYYGTWGPASSRSIKENFADFTNDEASAILKELTPLKYNLIGDENKNLHIGFIAEDVPDEIATKDRKSILPNHIIAVLTKVVQEQQNAINILTQKVNTLSA